MTTNIDLLNGGDSHKVWDIHNLDNLPPDQWALQVIRTLRNGDEDYQQAYHASQWIKHTNGILAGDFNAGPYSPFLKDLRKVATPYAVRSHGLRKIDMFWIPKGYYRHATVAGANGFSSDHRPVILHLGVK